MSQSRTNLLSRPYDVVIPAPLLSEVVERRRSPTGKQHLVREIKRAGVVSYAYPWDKMELGDFFVVAIGSRSPKALRVAFAHAAARHDFELAVTPWTMQDGQPGFRVCVVIIGVTPWKLKAEGKGVKGIRFSDGRWRGRKRQWEKDHRNKGKASGPAPKRTTPSKIDKSNPFFADGDPELPAPTMATAPEMALTREQMVARALGETV